VRDPDALVEGWAYDRAGVTMLEMSLDGESWEELALSGPDPSGVVFWSYTFACTACVDSLGVSDERAAVQVRGYDGTATADGLGHVNTSTTEEPILSFDIHFDVAAPVHEESSILDDFSTYENGESVRISSRWDDEGYEIYADFGAAVSGFDPEDVIVVDSGAGLYTITYTIPDDNTNVPVADAPVPITATDYFERAVSDTTITVSIDQRTDVGVSVALDKNQFDPVGGERVAIDIAGFEGDVVLEVYNLAGVLVRTIEQAAGSTLAWYGKNDADEVVASGVYFLRIAMDDTEIVRKVAVVK
jgi:hypothetical protein